MRCPPGSNTLSSASSIVLYLRRNFESFEKTTLLQSAPHPGPGGRPMCEGRELQQRGCTALQVGPVHLGCICPPNKTSLSSMWKRHQLTSCWKTAWSFFGGSILARASLHWATRCGHRSSKLTRALTSADMVHCIACHPPWISPKNCHRSLSSAAQQIQNLEIETTLSQTILTLESPSGGKAATNSSIISPTNGIWARCGNKVDRSDAKAVSPFS